MKSHAWLTLAILFLIAAPLAISQESGPIQPAAAVVKPHAYVSLEPVPRGKSFEIAVVTEIRQGYHMNSNKPSEEYLIPTTLSVQPPVGFKLLDTSYPPGEMLKFSFSPTPLSVYSGRVKILLRMQAGADAQLGAQTIPLTLRFQACNDTACLPPVRVPVEVKLQIAAAGTSAHSANAEIFSSRKQTPKN